MFLWRNKKNINNFYAPSSDDAGGVRGYVPMNVCPSVRMCVRDPVRLRLRHLYQVEFCSFIVRYPTAGASVYCEHISN